MRTITCPKCKNNFSVNISDDGCKTFSEFVKENQLEKTT